MFGLFKRKQPKHMASTPPSFGETPIKKSYPHQYSRGVFKGQLKVSSAESTSNRKNARKLYQRNNPITGKHWTVIDIAKFMHLSRSQIYTYLGDLVPKNPRGGKNA